MNFPLGKIRARLQPGEHVVHGEVVAEYGNEILDELNQTKPRQDS